MSSLPDVTQIRQLRGDCIGVDRHMHDRWPRQPTNRRGNRQHQLQTEHLHAASSYACKCTSPATHTHTHMVRTARWANQQRLAAHIPGVSQENRFGHQCSKTETATGCCGRPALYIQLTLGSNNRPTAALLWAVASHIIPNEIWNACGDDSVEVSDPTLYTNSIKIELYEFYHELALGREDVAPALRRPGLARHQQQQATASQGCYCFQTWIDLTPCVSCPSSRDSMNIPHYSNVASLYNLNTNKCNFNTTAKKNGTTLIQSFIQF